MFVLKSGFHVFYIHFYTKRELCVDISGVFVHYLFICSSSCIFSVVVHDLKFDQTKIFFESDNKE